MNEKLNSLIQMLSPKAKKLSKDACIESLDALNISDNAAVDFEASKKSVSMTIEKNTGNCTETITYSIKQVK